jgi:hypothetical protein
MSGVQLIDPSRQRFGLGVNAPRPVVQRGAIEAQKHTLLAHRQLLVLRLNHFPKLGS